MQTDKRTHGGRRPGAGRPPRVEGQASTVRFRFRLTRAQREHLQRVAAANFCTPTEVVRDAVLDYLAEHSERQTLELRRA